MRYRLTAKVKKASSQSFTIDGTDVDAAGFTKVLIDGSPASIGRVIRDRGTVIAWMPRSALTHIGSHRVQLVNRAGASMPVSVLVGKIHIPAKMHTLKEDPLMESRPLLNPTTGALNRLNPQPEPPAATLNR